MLKKNYVSTSLWAAARLGISLVLIFIIGSPSFPVKTQARERVKLINNLEEYGIRLIGPADESFDHEMSRYLGRNFSKLKPLIETAGSLAVLVKSESPKPVLGVSLRWEFVSDYGRVHIVPQAISSPGELMGLTVLDPNLQGKTSLLYGSNMMFFSPLQSVANVLVNSNKTVVFPAANYSIDSPGIAKAASLARSEMGMYQSSGRCRSVAVDGIVFNDGTFVGDNHTGFFDTMRGSLDAKRDFLESLKKAKSEPGGLARALVEFAEADHQQPREAPGVLVEDKYRSSYVSSMRSLREQIRRHRAAGKEDLDIAQKEYIDRYTNFVALKRL